MDGWCKLYGEKFQKIIFVWKNYDDLRHEFLKSGNRNTLKRALKNQEDLGQKVDYLRQGMCPSLEYAEKILGENFIGPEDVKEVFGYLPEKLPGIHFTNWELKRAKELGMFLILRINETVDKLPLNLEELDYVRMAKNIADFGQGGWLTNVLPSREERVLERPIEKIHWALVTREEIPGSRNKNYLEQTSMIIDYLKTKFLKGSKIPYRKFEYDCKEFARASDTFKSRQYLITRFEISQRARPSPAEAVYDLLLYYHKNKRHIFRDCATWTNIFDNRYRLVAVGGKIEGRLPLCSLDAGSPDSDTGAFISYTY